MSNLEKHIRATVFVFRFLAGFKKSGACLKNRCIQRFREFDKSKPYPSPAESTYVRGLFVRREQQRFLGAELALLGRGESLPRKHHLARLYPFVDDGVMKVGGGGSMRMSPSPRTGSIKSWSQRKAHSRVCLWRRRTRGSFVERSRAV